MEFSAEIWTMIVGFGLTIVTVLFAIISTNQTAIGKLRTETDDRIDKLRNQFREDISDLQESMDDHIRELREEMQKSPHAPEGSQNLENSETDGTT